MDNASIIGMLIGFGALGFVFFEVSHGHLMMFFSTESVLMVDFGSISVTFMAMPMDKMKQVASYIKKILFDKGIKPIQVIELMNF